MEPQCLVDREDLLKKIEKDRVGGNYTPFFCINFLEYFYGDYRFSEFTNCHDVAAKSSTLDYKGLWVFHIVNYFDESIAERLSVFLSLFRKTQSIHKLVEPKFTIINDINIKVECNTNDYKQPYKRLFLLKLFRFSYFYHGETIGQLFLNQRYYKTSNDCGEMYSSGESKKICYNPTAWFYSLINYDNNDNNFLDSEVNKKLIRENEIYSSVRNFEKGSVQLQPILTKPTIPVNAGNKGF